jgi:hypothetical protein
MGSLLDHSLPIPRYREIRFGSPECRGTSVVCPSAWMPKKVLFAPCSLNTKPALLAAKINALPTKRVYSDTSIAHSSEQQQSHDALHRLLDLGDKINSLHDSLLMLQLRT